MGTFNIPAREVIYCKDEDRIDELKKMANEIEELGFETQIRYGYYEGIYMDIILNNIDIEFIYLDNTDYTIRTKIEEINDLNIYILNDIDELKIEQEFFELFEYARKDCFREESVYVEEAYSLNNILNDIKDKCYEIDNICKKYGFTGRGIGSYEGSYWDIANKG